MSTRGNIIVQMKNGRWGKIYTHWDGYISHNGRILFEHYKTLTLAQQLIRLGDLSSLGETIGEKHDFEFQTAFYQRKRLDASYDQYLDPEFIRLNRMCHVYGRDRGEKNTRPKYYATVREALDSGIEEYVYVYYKGVWGVTEDGVKFTNLEKAILAENEPETAKPDVSDATVLKGIFE